MAYKNKTVEEVQTLLINSFQEEFNKKIKILPKSFIVILSKVIAGVFVVLYKLVGWYFLQLYPETADWEEVTILGVKLRPLVKLGVMFGVGNPFSGTAWEGIAEVDVVVSSSVLYSGTQLKSAVSGKLYFVAETQTLKESVEKIKLECFESGTAGTLAKNDVLNFVSPLGFVKQEVEVFESVKAGLDDESEVSYRNRVINRFRMQPQGGSLADYRIWASEVSGVLNVYPYNDEDLPGGVLLYVSGVSGIYEDRIPDTGLLKAVGMACTYDSETGLATRKPLTAVLDPQNDESFTNVRPISVKKFDIVIRGVSGSESADFAKLVKPALENYFLERDLFIRGLSIDNKKNNLISKNHIISVVNQVAVSVKASFETAEIRFNGSVISSYVLDKGELSKLGSFSVNGGSY